MAHQTRRTFLRRSGTAGLTIVAASAARTFAANEQLAVGLIGCGIRGMSFHDTVAGVRYVCDPDRKRLAQAAERFEVPEERAITDLRCVLDDKSVDCVFIATPDHWHAPAGIMACDAGKHAYVEKPCSHNVREGRLLVEAARRNNVVVQHGTQSRSSQFIANGIQMLREGIIGDVLVEIGHLSATLGHLANIATRLRRTLHFDPVTERIAGDDEASALLSREYREGGHWAIPKGV